MGKPVVVVASILGIIFLGLMVYYFVTPASALPSFFPGFDATSAAHHTKHAIVALVIALALFALAWFQSKPAKAS